MTGKRPAKSAGARSGALGPRLEVLGPPRMLLLGAGLALLALACGGGESDEGEVTPPVGPLVVAPRLVPAPVVQPDVELPTLSWPQLASPRVETPALERPRLQEPELLDPYQVDVFEQRILSVDVLWIVDNSGSMANERASLARAFEDFIAVLAERRIDYHVGVISTEVTEDAGGELREARDGSHFITHETQDPRTAFGDMVSFVPGRGRREQGFEALRLALSEPLASTSNRGFLRSDSALAVVVVSDEDDGSFGSPGYFTRFLQHTREPGDEETVSFSAIVGLPPDGCTPPGEEQVFGAKAEVAERYLEVVESTSGLNGSICEQDFQPILEALGRRLGALTRIFPLSSLPQEDSLTVRVDGQLVQPSLPDAPGWTYQEGIRALVFDEEALPGSGSVVRVAYVVDAGVAR